MKYLLIFLAVLFVTVPLPAQVIEPPSPCCMLGDMNGSGGLSTLDVVLVSRHAAGITCMDEEDQCNADVDGDGVVTQLDAELIRQYVLGVISTFPRCGDLDGDGQLEWFSGGGDLNAFTGCAIGGGQRCENADANDNGGLTLDDIFIFTDLANGQIQNFPGCACGEGACAVPQ